MKTESQPLRLGGRGLLLCWGILSTLLAAVAAPTLAQEAQEQDSEEIVETLEVGLAFSPVVQSRVNRELVSLCGGFRCEDYRRVVRVAIQPGDSLEQLIDRLTGSMLSEVERTFAAANSPERVIIEGYVFRGTDAFVTVEVPLLVMFVPRHRWVVERFGIEDDSIFYPELIRQVETALGNVAPSQIPVPSEALPPLPPPPPPAPPPAQDGTPEGSTEREPIESESEPEPESESESSS